MSLAVVQSSVALVIAFCGVAVCRRRSAAIRHLILVAGLLGALLIPALPPLPRLQGHRGQTPRPPDSATTGTRGLTPMPPMPLENTVDLQAIAMRSWPFG